MGEYGEDGYTDDPLDTSEEAMYMRQMNEERIRRAKETAARTPQY